VIYQPLPKLLESLAKQKLLEKWTNAKNFYHQCSAQS
jgi:hypothetical protein